MTGGDNRRPTRRTALAAMGLGILGAGQLASCTAAVPPPSPAVTPSRATNEPRQVDVSPTPPFKESTGTPAEPSAAQPQLSDAELLARFSGRRPSHWGMEVSGVITHTGQPGIALTLDACGGGRGSGLDTELLDFLRTSKIPATLFLNRRWVEANTAYARELAADPLFQIANHGTAHRPLSVDGRAAYGIAGTTSALEAWHEVRDNHQFLADELGVETLWFRSGTAHYDDVGVEIANLSGEMVAGFSINADAGATASASAIRREMLKAAPGDIVIAHMNQPDGDTAEGLSAGLLAAQERGLTFVRLPRRRP